MIWLVMMSLTQPMAAPQMVGKFGTVQECSAAAVNANQVDVPYGTLARTKTPKGKYFLCMQPVYPT